jgi:uncharacterized protein (TIGR00369 family)
MSVDREVSYGLGDPLTEGDWAGWSIWSPPDPFEDHVGPFYANRDPDGRMICGCRVQAKNMNGSGIVHGGALLTFADYSLFIVSYDHTRNQPGVTVTLNAEFLSAAPLDARLISRGEVTKAGRSLIFVRGLIEADGVHVLNYSGVIKLLKRTSQRAPHESNE